jgi:hypothetical protein
LVTNARQKISHTVGVMRAAKMGQQIAMMNAFDATNRRTGHNEKHTVLARRFG